MAKGATEAIGLTQLLEEWGRQRTMEVATDSSAAFGTVHRRGNGKLCHVKINDWWLQESEYEGSLSVTKVSGAENIADILTKDAAKGSSKACCKGHCSLSMCSNCRSS